MTELIVISSVLILLVISLHYFLKGKISLTGDKNGLKGRITFIAKGPRLPAPAFVAVLLIAFMAVGCTSTGAKNQAEIVLLTAEEVGQYNKAFEPLLFDEQGDSRINPLSHFLRSYYDKPENLNLADFLRYYPPDRNVTNEAEFEALKAERSWPFGADMAWGDMPVPIHKFSADTVNEVLKKYMGITLDDLSGVGMDELIYLKEYDAYYNFTSDVAYGSFICMSGETQGDIIRLYSESAILTLYRQGNGFLFVSHQLTDGASGSGKENKDVTLYDCGGLSIAIPNEYIENLVVNANPKPEAAGNGLLISVYEKQSYEESRADYGEEGATGFMFSIVRYTQAQYEQFLCSDGSGHSFFARDDTYYYDWFAATDVQFYRSGMGSPYTDSSGWKEWQTLNQKCNTIKDDFISRNHLTPYSDSEFQSKQFTYDSEHLYLIYYPYYAYQDIAVAQGFTWQDVAYRLVLSQPATQGKTGIWCVERWYDEHGSLYPYFYFPNANGVPAAQYYADQQAQCDKGRSVLELDPKQVALMFVRQYFGHTEAALASLAIGDETFIDKNPSPARAN